MCRMNIKSCCLRKTQCHTEDEQALNKCLPVQELDTHQTGCKWLDHLPPICCLNVSMGSWTHNRARHSVTKKKGGKS